MEIGFGIMMGTNASISSASYKYATIYVREVIVSLVFSG